MRRTVDLPDDLAEDLEKMSRKVSMSQAGLLTIAGYSLISKYKTHGASLFELPAENGRVTLIDSGVTSENIKFVKEHLADFGQITSVMVFGMDNLPEQYVVPRPFGDGSFYRVKYRLILTNEKDKEWWFAGCSCGYGGEGVSGTHTILSLLGIPFSYMKLTRQDYIIHQAYTDFRFKVSLERMSTKKSLGTWNLELPSAVAQFRFIEGIEKFGFAVPVSMDQNSYEADMWDRSRHYRISRDSKLDDDALFIAFEEELEHVVRYQLRGSIAIEQSTE